MEKVEINNYEDLFQVLDPIIVWMCHEVKIVLGENEV